MSTPQQETRDAVTNTVWVGRPHRHQFCDESRQYSTNGGYSQVNVRTKLGGLAASSMYPPASPEVTRTTETCQV